MSKFEHRKAIEESIRRILTPEQQKKIIEAADYAEQTAKEWREQTRVPHELIHKPVCEKPTRRLR